MQRDAENLLFFAAAAHREATLAAEARETNGDKTHNARKSKAAFRKAHPDHLLSDITRKCLIELVTTGVLVTTAKHVAGSTIWCVKVNNHEHVLARLAAEWGADEPYTQQMMQELKSYNRDRRENKKTYPAYPNLVAYSRRLEMGGVLGRAQHPNIARYAMPTWTIDTSTKSTPKSRARKSRARKGAIPGLSKNQQQAEL